MHGCPQQSWPEPGERRAEVQSSSAVSISSFSCQGSKHCHDHTPDQRGSCLQHVHTGISNSSHMLLCKTTAREKAGWTARYRTGHSPYRMTSSWRAASRDAWPADGWSGKEMQCQLFLLKSKARKTACRAGAAPGLLETLPPCASTSELPMMNSRCSQTTPAIDKGISFLCNKEATSYHVSGA